MNLPYSHETENGSFKFEKAKEVIPSKSTISQ